MMHINSQVCIIDQRLSVQEKAKCHHQSFLAKVFISFRTLLQPAILSIVNENYTSAIIVDDDEDDDDDDDDDDNLLHNILNRLPHLRDYFRITWSMVSLHTNHPPSPSPSETISFDSFV